MGGAFTAVADDISMFAVNPAGSNLYEGIGPFVSAEAIVRVER